jgi:hypothetical protein
VKFAILQSYGTDATSWSYLISKLNREDRDLHFLPEYGNLYRTTYDFEPFLVFFGDDEHYVIQPFVKRLLNKLPFLAEQNIAETYFDIANPYGYGGPVFRCDSPDEARILFQEFNRHFCEYCMEERIASEFTSLHPFLNSREVIIASGLIDLVQCKDVVYIDLSLPEDEIWKGINRGHRSSINKSKKSGVVIEKVEPSPGHLKVFNGLYFQTMERNQAAARWFFPEDYFQNCCDILGPDRVSLFFAYINGGVASAYLLIHDFTTAYYHFGGSDERFYDFRPNNLLMYEAALWAKRQGYLRFHLGGGVSSAPDDSLLRYKSGFSGRKAALYTYSRIHHKQTYERLCEFKKSYELTTNGAVSVSDYFPLYRR